MKKSILFAVIILIAIIVAGAFIGLYLSNNSVSKVFRVEGACNILPSV